MKKKKGILQNVNCEDFNTWVMELILPKLQNFRSKMASYSIRLTCWTNTSSINKFNCDGTALYVILTLIRTLFLALIQIMVRSKFTKEVKR